MHVAFSLSILFTTRAIYINFEVFATYPYLPLVFIFFMNFHILSVARKQRKRILVKTTIPNVDKSTDESGNTNRNSFRLRFFCVFENNEGICHCRRSVNVLYTNSNHSWTDAIRILYCSMMQVWYVFFQYKLYEINSVVNAFIYGMRHVKNRKTYLHILFKLFSCHKATN